MTDDPDAGREPRLSSDSETVRGWANEHGAVPVREAASSDEPNRLRLLPEAEAGDTQERLEWEAFFAEIDERESVVVYREGSADEPLTVERRARVGRAEDVGVGTSPSTSAASETSADEDATDGDDADKDATDGEESGRGEETSASDDRAAGDDRAADDEPPLGPGLDGMEFESEVVEREELNHRVVDAQLQQRRCTGCELVEDDKGAAGVFPADRYLQAVRAEAVGETGGTPGLGDESAQATEGVEATEARESELTGTGDDRAFEAGETVQAGPCDGPDGGAGAIRTEQPTMGDAEAETTAYGSEESVPYRAVLEVEERWLVTREFLERVTVESRVAPADGAANGALGDHDVDLAELQRWIVETGLLDGDPVEGRVDQGATSSDVDEGDDIEGDIVEGKDHADEDLDAESTDDLLAQYDVESTVSADVRIETSFVRERTVEEEVVGHSRLRGDVSERELRGVDRETAEAVARTAESEADDDETAESAETASTESPSTDGTASGDAAEVAPDTDADLGEPTFSDSDVGKPVVDAEGERLGLVMDLEEDGRRAFVQAEPGISKRLRAALGWGARDEDDARLSPGQVVTIRDDEVELADPSVLSGESDR